ncbi:hypothetical protein IEQ34_001452 [Dendrobium chrysotoxum]|uniref:Uncharacterized protein n=1 Tax=Dendrobium chrysotoxum TaxID=161865 RepID=A0AAV7HQ33_DENCH|nr:hypothetical protein IEQ34_001452 [Dendrobium chrysotoxum]
MYLVQHPRTQPNHGPKKLGGVRSQTGRRTLPRRSLLPEESPYGPEWGHGGMGKTTFLQHVYEDEMTEEI